MSGPVLLAGRTVQLRGSRLARAVLEGAGWRLDFQGLPARQGVLVLYPHTSNWDFPLGLLAKWAAGIPVTFWGKDSAFKLPLFGAWLRWLGGVPVDRGAPQGIVGDMVLRMQRARERGEFLWLALMPEGTRSRTAGWRSGFYRVATQAQVPLALVCFDYGARRVGVDTFLQLCGDAEPDMAEIERRLAGCKGYRPDLASPIRLS
jgi:1-acyl-sn-glycerol-3-phosphate acyltransferase